MQQSEPMDGMTTSDRGIIRGHHHHELFASNVHKRLLSLHMRPTLQPPQSRGKRVTQHINGLLHSIRESQRTTRCCQIRCTKSRISKAPLNISFACRQRHKILTMESWFRPTRLTGWAEMRGQSHAYFWLSRCGGINPLARSTTLLETLSYLGRDF